MKLWHCKDARSLRPLWVLEELNLEYELEVLPFPPRVFKKEFLALNPLGTIPYFVDGDVKMTESTAICLYLANRYEGNNLSLSVMDTGYGEYLNWLFMSDATLTFPQTIVLRYTQLEPEERRLPQAASDYRKWFLARLRMLDAHLLGNKYLCNDTFTIADIAIGYALFLGENLGIADDYQPQTQAYLQQLKQRPAFKRARLAGK